jgi:hypothetical protein
VKFFRNLARGKGSVFLINCITTFIVTILYFGQVHIYIHTHTHTHTYIHTHTHTHTYTYIYTQTLLFENFVWYDMCFMFFRETIFFSIMCLCTRSAVCVSHKISMYHYLTYAGNGMLTFSSFPKRIFSFMKNFTFSFIPCQYWLNFICETIL